GAASQGFAFSGLLSVGCIISLHLRGHYVQRQPAWDDLGVFWSAIGIVAILDATARLSTVGASGIVPATLGWIALAIVRPIARISLRNVLRAAGLWQIPTVIIGTGDTARDAAMAIGAEPMLGFDVRLFAAIASVHPAGVIVGASMLPVANLDER